MELVYFEVRCKKYDTFDPATKEPVEEGITETLYIALHKLGDFFNEAFTIYEKVDVIARMLKTVYTEEEYNDLAIENDNLKTKLDDAWNFIDNVEEHLYDIRTRIEDSLSDIDDAEEDCQSAKDECEHD